jgi:hypothetical protein
MGVQKMADFFRIAWCIFIGVMIRMWWDERSSKDGK